MWQNLGPAANFANRPLTAATIGQVRIVVTWQDGQFGALSGVCNHAGGPLADGRLDGEYVVCPWHNWKYHCRSGLGDPGFEIDAVPRYDVKVEDGNLYVSEQAASKRTRGAHPLHPLARKVERTPGPVRVLGISTTRAASRYAHTNARHAASDASK